jgi:FkbM family methyltransferase
MSVIAKVFRKLSSELTAVDSLGGTGWFRYRSQRRRLKRASRSELVALTSRDLKHPVYCRPSTSDAHVFHQIFIEREYGCLDDLDTRAECLIVDCGANVGYSSAYFLSRFPACRVVAVEPDPENFALLRKNVAPYGERVLPIRAGIWSHPASLKLRDERVEEGNEWNQSVRECEPGEPANFKALSVGSILDASGFGRIAVLKMDIEGAEAVVFAGGHEDWLPRVDNLVIELHAYSPFGATHAVFGKAVEGTDFAITESGELTVCRRPRASANGEPPGADRWAAFRQTARTDFPAE